MQSPTFGWLALLPQAPVASAISNPPNATSVRTVRILETTDILVNRGCRASLAQ